MDKLEKKARTANFVSLAFCLIAISIKLKSPLNYIIGVLALLQILHLFFGDVTDSYRLLRKKMFLRFYAYILVLFSLLLVIILLIGDITNRLYFFIALLAFLGDFTANKIRVKQLDSIKKYKKEKNK